MEITESTEKIFNTETRSNGGSVRRTAGHPDVIAILDLPQASNIVS